MNLLTPLKELVKWLDDSNLAATPSGGVPPFTYGGTEYEVVRDARAAIAAAEAAAPVVTIARFDMD